MSARTVSASDTSVPASGHRLPNGVLVVIVLLVGLMAGAASFTHVHEWTLDNSPDGTADWFGWANAVISELIPTASLIEIGRRRRRDPACSVRYPMSLLVLAVGVSLTAQLAVAEPSVFGWMVSALPALAFFALSKLVFTTTPSRPTIPVAADMPATSPASSTDTTRAQVRPAAAAKTRATTATNSTRAKTTPSKRTAAKKTTAPAAVKTVPAEPVAVAARTPAVPEPRFPGALLANARTIAVSHRDQHGEDITPGQMAVRLRVPTPVATDILTELSNRKPAHVTTRPHNGSPVEVTA